MKKIIITLVMLVLVIGMVSAQEEFTKQHHPCERYGEGQGKGRGEGHGKGFGKQHHGMMGKGMGGPQFHEQMMEELDMTDDQKDKIREFQTDNKKLAIQKQSEIKILRIEIHEALRKQKFSEAKRITEKISDIEKDLAVNRIDMHEKHWKILTDDQKEKAKEMKKDKPMMMMKNKHMKGKF